MPIYRVVTQETSVNTYEVEAKSKDDAIDSYYESFNTRRVMSSKSREAVVNAEEIFPTDEFSK